MKTTKQPAESCPLIPIKGELNLAIIAQFKIEVVERDPRRRVAVVLLTNYKFPHTGSFEFTFSYEALEMALRT